MNAYDIERAIAAVNNFLLDWIVPLVLGFVLFIAILGFASVPIADSVWARATGFGSIGQWVVYVPVYLGIILVSLVASFGSVGFLWWQVRLRRRYDLW